MPWNACCTAAYYYWCAPIWQMFILVHRHHNLALTYLIIYNSRLITENKWHILINQDFLTTFLNAGKKKFKKNYVIVCFTNITAIFFFRSDIQQYIMNHQYKIIISYKHVKHYIFPSLTHTTTQYTQQQQ